MYLYIYICYIYIYTIIYEEQPTGLLLEPYRTILNLHPWVSHYMSFPFP